MTQSPVATVLAFVAAFAAWIPGVAPSPWSPPVVEAVVPSWLEPESCHRDARLERWLQSQETDPADALADAMACTRHTPARLDGLMVRYQLGRDVLDNADPEDALLVWAFAQDLTEGPILGWMVGLSLQEQALTVLESQALDDGVSQRILEVRARRRPLSLAGERAVSYALSGDLRGRALRQGDVASWLVAPVHARQTVHFERDLRDALLAPAEDRLTRVEATLADADPRWRRLGPAAFLFDQGQRAWWANTSGKIVRDAVAQEVAIQARADALAADARTAAHP